METRAYSDDLQARFRIVTLHEVGLLDHLRDLGVKFCVRVELVYIQRE